MALARQAPSLPEPATSAAAVIGLPQSRGRNGTVAGRNCCLPVGHLPEPSVQGRGCGHAGGCHAAPGITPGGLSLSSIAETFDVVHADGVAELDLGQPGCQVSGPFAAARQVWFRSCPRGLSGPEPLALGDADMETDALLQLIERPSDFVESAFHERRQTAISSCQRHVMKL